MISQPLQQEENNKSQESDDLVEPGFVEEDYVSNKPQPMTPLKEEPKGP